LVNTFRALIKHIHPVGRLPVTWVKMTLGFSENPKAGAPFGQGPLWETVSPGALIRRKNSPPKGAISPKTN